MKIGNRQTILSLKKAIYRQLWANLWLNVMN